MQAEGIEVRGADENVGFIDNKESKGDGDQPSYEQHAPILIRPVVVDLEGNWT